jgi:hypothetical protein
VAALTPEPYSHPCNPAPHRVKSQAETGFKIGYARVSTDAQELTAQRQALAGLGVERTGSTSTTA